MPKKFEVGLQEHISSGQRIVLFLILIELKGVKMKLRIITKNLSPLVLTATTRQRGSYSKTFKLAFSPFVVYQELNL